MSLNLTWEEIEILQSGIDLPPNERRLLFALPFGERWATSIDIIARLAGIPETEIIPAIESIQNKTGYKIAITDNRVFVPITENEIIKYC